MEGGRGGVKTCPMDGVADGSLHPVPRRNTFESFVVALQEVRLGGFILTEEQSHGWLGIPALIGACLSWVSPSHPSHSTALNYGSASGAGGGLWFLPSGF